MRNLCLQAQQIAYSEAEFKYSQERGIFAIQYNISELLRIYSRLGF